MPSNRLEDLDPVVAATAIEHERRVKALGIDCCIRHTSISILEHQAYYAQGREDTGIIMALRNKAGLYQLPHDKYKIKVTWTLWSVHIAGCAWHLLLKRNGVICWDVNEDINNNGISDYEEMGRIGEELGCKWGVGNPRRDQVHYELTAGLTKDELKQGRRPVDIMAVPTFREPEQEGI